MSNLVNNFLDSANGLLELAKTDEIDFVDKVNDILEKIDEFKKRDIKKLRSASGNWMPKDEANQYINWYVGQPESFIVNADRLRELCSDLSIENVQIILGDKHNSPAALELTLLLVGLNSNYDHVYYELNGQENVLEYVQPCPNNTGAHCASKMLE